MSFLKTAWQLNQAKGEDLSIIDRLRGTVGGYEKARPYKKIHASEVTKDNFCPRKVALMDLSGKKLRDEFISTALKATFDVGNAISEVYRTNWAAQWTYGHWECRRCGEVKTFCTKPKSIDLICKHDWKFD